MNEFLLSRFLGETSAAFNLLNEYIENTVYGPRPFQLNTLESLLEPIIQNLHQIEYIIKNQKESEHKK